LQPDVGPLGSLNCDWIEGKAERMAQGGNPALPAGVRLFSAAVIIVLLMGAGLFFVPDLVKARWPWALTPFNARFLGSFYLAEMVAMVALLVWNRWSPGRMILIMAFVFTAVVSAFTLFHLYQFNLARKSPWIWLVVYIGSALISFWFLWRTKDTPPVAAAVSGPAWRRYFNVEAALFMLYGLALIILPGIFAGFWPWPIDAFHAQIYSAIFVTAAAGNQILAHNAPREEVIALGAAQLALGMLAVAGLLMTDAAVKRVDWSASGTYLWLALFGLIAATGLAKLGAAFAKSKA
jgi:hypothetical protein